MKKILTSYILILLLIFVGCKKEDNPIIPPTINESEVLVKYLESTGDFINISGVAMTSATTVYANLNSGTQYVIDIRDTTAFKTGHINGAKNVKLAEIVTHIKTIPATYTSVVIACYSGQTASFATSMLRLMGYSKVSTLKWGMASWDTAFAKTTWTVKTSNSYSSQFVTTASSKNAKGNLPTLNTGKTTGPEILEARVNELLTAGFTPSTVTNASVFANLSGYYIVNYWPVAEYNLGHIPGAIQYAKPDMRDSLFLRTLPTNKPIAIYCYTGQTSAYLIAYLKILGYDAKSLLYGTNGMAYDMMTANKFTSAEIKNYPYATGP